MTGINAINRGAFSAHRDARIIRSDSGGFMDYLVWLNFAMAASAAIGFIFGAYRYLRPHKTLYASMIVLGVGCIMIGKVHTFLRMLTGLEVNNVFHAGILGTVGAFAFFFSSNYGQIDSLVDDRGKEFAKYRLFGLVGLLIPAAMYSVIIFSPASTAEKISDGVAAASVCAAAYFHVKHIFIPDVDYGVVKCLRGYNILAFSYGILCILEMATDAYEIPVAVIAVCVLECIVSAVLVPVMHKGVLNWSR